MVSNEKLVCFFSFFLSLYLPSLCWVLEHREIRRRFSFEKLTKDRNYAFSGQNKWSFPQIFTSNGNKLMLFVPNAKRLKSLNMEHFLNAHKSYESNLKHCDSLCFNKQLVALRLSIAIAVVAFKNIPNRLLSFDSRSFWWDKRLKFFWNYWNFVSRLRIICARRTFHFHFNLWIFVNNIGTTKWWFKWIKAIHYSRMAFRW